MKERKVARISRNYVALSLAIACVVLLVFVVVISFYPLKGMTGYATSQVGNLTASVATYISCTWSDAALSVSFGSDLTPGTNDVNATGSYALANPSNGTQYNVTVDTLSNVNANMTVKGADLVSGANLIGIGNVTWSSNTTSANATQMNAGAGYSLQTTYDTTNKVASNEPIGSSVWYRFWLDIPTGTIAGAYVGNYTMQCSAAS